MVCITDKAPTAPPGGSQRISEIGYWAELGFTDQVVVAYDVWVNDDRHMSERGREPSRQVIAMKSLARTGLGSTTLALLLAVVVAGQAAGATWIKVQVASGFLSGLATLADGTAQ